jgi:hypothetical protein
MKQFVLILSFALLSTSLAQADKLSGTWVKYYIGGEGCRYKADPNLTLEVTFDPNGKFVWHSVRKEADKKLDELITGTYSIERAEIHYHFENVSEAAKKILSEYFAYWPNKQTGIQTFHFNGESMSLAHDGGKIWFRMKKKSSTTRPV